MGRGWRLVAAVVLGLSRPAVAEQISVTHWGALLYGVPHAVAMDRGYFREAGVDVTGILTTQGGGMTVRHVLAAGLPYGEMTLSAALAARRDGFDVVIVNAGVRVAADVAWVAMPDSDTRSIRDLAGRRMAITSARSVTDMLSMMALAAAGVSVAQVERPTLGGIGAALTALENGLVQAAPIIEPILSARHGRYRVVLAVGDLLPALTQTVGVTTREFAATRPGIVRAIIAGRRRGVEFIAREPDEAARILARAYDNLTVAVAERAVRAMAAANYWSRGDFEPRGLDEMVRGLRQVGEIEGEVDWERLIDRSFLPEDLRP